MKTKKLKLSKLSKLNVSSTFTLGFTPGFAMGNPTPMWWGGSGG